MRPEYCWILPGGPMPELGPKPYLLLLVAELGVEPEWRNELADHLIATGCFYFCACGVDCSIWHDCVDVAVLEKFDFKGVPNEEFVMTTCHENEPLEEAMWFAHHGAGHPFAVFERCHILHLAHNAEQQRMLARYEAAVHAPLDEKGNAPWDGKG